jgi:hypothetical protein
MSRNKLVTKTQLLALILFSGALNPPVFSQQVPASSVPAQAPALMQTIELPVIMREKVVAGSTPIDTKIEAKLEVATLVNGVVIPKGTVLSGEVTESSAKTATAPSHLAIRIDSAQWKNGSLPIKAYLTAWYYPEVAMSAQDVSYQPADVAQSPKNWNGAGTYPQPGNLAAHPFPNADQQHDQGAPNTPGSTTAKNRALMKYIESSTKDDGTVVLTSTHSTIKLDKITTYVLANGDLIRRN